MPNNISLGDVQQELGQVMHPATSRSLVELGIVKDVALKYMMSSHSLYPFLL